MPSSSQDVAASVESLLLLLLSLVGTGAEAAKKVLACSTVKYRALPSLSSRGVASCCRKTRFLRALSVSGLVLSLMADETALELKKNPGLTGASRLPDSHGALVVNVSGGGSTSHQLVWEQ
jgi:hypothetical protein